MEAKIPLAFAAGLLSFATPCVLPLVPGYLAAVSGGEAGVGGRRVLVASVPFVAGFTAVFVGLGAAAAAAGGLFAENQRLLQAVAGLVIVVLGFAFMGLLPVPWLDRLVAPELVEGARASGSAALLGAAFAVCAAPCVGPVLGTILALASEGQTVAQGTLLLLVYSAGLALPFLAVGLGFDRSLAAFRWLRDRYGVLRIVAGALLVAVGLLLFFDRFWWLRVAVNRVFEFFGIGV
jgi:cytochrome c-type biogenesis protein